MKLKYCGLKTVEDYLCAWELEIDYVGFVSYTKSPRYIAPMHAAHIVHEARMYMQKIQSTKREPMIVGLFVDIPIAEINWVIHNVGFCAAQIYQDEYASVLHRPFWKVVHIAFDDNFIPHQDSFEKEKLAIIEQEAAQNELLEAVVLDTKQEHDLGGSGKTFNWAALDSLEIRIPYFVAGGINKDNITELLQYKPYGIDISSGIETTLGVKDHGLMEKIAKIVREYDDTQES